MAVIELAKPGQEAITYELIVSVANAALTVTVVLATQVLRHAKIIQTYAISVLRPMMTSPMRTSLWLLALRQLLTPFDSVTCREGGSDDDGTCTSNQVTCSH